MGVLERPTAGGLGGWVRQRTAPAGLGPKRSSAKQRQGLAPPAATGDFHLAPADRGISPEPQRLATGRLSHPASRRRGLIPAVQIHGARLRTFPRRHPGSP